MKKLKFLFLIILFVIGCNAQTEEISFSDNTPEMTEEAKKFENDNQKKMLYMEVIMNYWNVGFENSFFKDYKDTFLENNNYKILSENEINQFWEKWVVYYYERLRFSIYQAEKEIESEPRYKDLDIQMKNFFEALKSENDTVWKMRNYYEKKEYKKDNFQKGKNLNEKYLKEVRNTSAAYKKAYFSFMNINYALQKERINKYDKNNEPLRRDYYKLVILLSKLRTELRFSENRIDLENSEYIIQKEEKNTLLKELKMINKTLEKVLKENKKIKPEEFFKEDIDKVKYDEFLKQAQDIFELSKNIEKDIEKNQNSFPNILKYTIEDNKNLKFRVDIEKIIDKK